MKQSVSASLLACALACLSSGSPGQTTGGGAVDNRAVEPA